MPRIPEGSIKKMALVMLEKLGIPEDLEEIGEAELLKLNVFNQMLGLISVAGLELHMETKDIKMIWEAALEVHMELAKDSTKLAEKFFKNVRNN